MHRTRVFSVALFTALSSLVTAPTPLVAQPATNSPPSTGDIALAAARQSGSVLKLWITKSSALMNEEDFAARPTADTRTFGQLMAHVADRNFEFCSASLGEPAPMQGVEKTKTTKADIERAVAASFAYCDTAYTRVGTPGSTVMATLHGQRMPSLAVLLFLMQHNALHYGNAITYLRMRGKVPPSTSHPITGG